METLDQLNTKVVIAMGEKITAYEAEIARLSKRVTELETIIANQRAMINELQ
jgi:cell division protein FtsB